MHLVCFNSPLRCSDLGCGSGMLRRVGCGGHSWKRRPDRSFLFKLRSPFDAKSKPVHSWFSLSWQCRVLYPGSDTSLDLPRPLAMLCRNAGCCRVLKSRFWSEGCWLQCWLLWKIRAVLVLSLAHLLVPAHAANFLRSAHLKGPVRAYERMLNYSI